MSLEAVYPFDHSLELEVVGASTFACLVDIECEVSRRVLDGGELPLLFRHSRPDEYRPTLSCHATPMLRRSTPSECVEASESTSHGRVSRLSAMELNVDAHI